MASKDTIPGDSTIATLPAIAGLKRKEYIRHVVANFYASGLDREKAVVRIGTQGRGTSPHYKIEYPDTLKIDGLDLGLKISATYQIYNGSNHKQMTAFEIAQIRSEHWSTRTMTFSEVSDLLGVLRSKSRKP
jgi:hypothetical protein